MRAKSALRLERCEGERPRALGEGLGTQREFMTDGSQCVTGSDILKSTVQVNDTV